MTTETLTFTAAVQLGGVTDENVAAADLESQCGLEVGDARFELTDLPLAEVAVEVCDPADYADDGDYEAEETVAELVEAYTAGAPVPPVLVGRHRRDPARRVVLDGRRRLCAARAAGLATVPAYEAVAVARA